MVAVQLLDPTDWNDLIILLSTMALGSIIGFFCLRYSIYVMKVIGVLLVMVSVLVPPLMESTRESTIIDSNQHAIMKAYKLNDLEQDNKTGDDGMWLDPSAGRITHVGARWSSHNGKACYKGNLVMSYPVNGKPIGQLVPESSCPVYKENK